MTTKQLIGIMAAILAPKEYGYEPDALVEEAMDLYGAVLRKCEGVVDGPEPPA